MTLNLRRETHPISNRPFKSTGDDRVLMHAEGQMTDTTLIFHARDTKTNNLALITEILWGPDDKSMHHIHDLEDEAFYIIEGSLTVHTPNGDFLVEKGQMVWGPRGIQHGYSIGPEGARILLVQTPGTRLSEYFASSSEIVALEGQDELDEYFAWSEREYSLHYFDPATHPPGQSTTIERQEGSEVSAAEIAAFAEPLSYTIRNREVLSDGQDTVEVAGRRFTFHLGGHQSGGSVGIVAIDWSADEVTPFLTHQIENQCHYVVSGQLDVVLEDGEVLSAGAGELVWIPRGVKHAYRVGPDGAHAILCYFPGTRIDQLFRYAAELGDVTSDPERLRVYVAWVAETFSVDLDLTTAPAAVSAVAAG